MKMRKEQQVQMPQEDRFLLKMLDKGIDDLEAGRELPLEEAFQKVAEFRNLG